MSVANAILTGLVPSFLMVGLGGLVRRRLAAEAWAGLDRLNFEVLFPALLFTAAASRPIPPERLFTIGPAVWAIMVLGALCGLAGRRFGPPRFLDFAGAWQVAWRFNTAMGFVVLASLSMTDAALMAVIAGLAVPVANLFAVGALSRGSALGIGATLRQIALNPFLLASLSGVAVGLSGLTVPAPIMAPLELVAQAAIPVALISIGATMDWRALARLDAFAGVLTGTKLIVLPTATLAVCLGVGAPPAVAASLTAFAALPTATAAHVLAAGFGADRRLAATLVAQSTLAAALTLPLWILVIEATWGR